ncbi:uncharacterized protein si:dkey-9i23.16 isoform X1 [Salmo trutta]|uniref:uncharacterized protein si:dkey-9i23.16 isoform X1 n=1 Tax=Salmo trutta TaxID=8032 RepID=UPI00113258A3|nr:uncharacterized protein LOC115202170 isoform X1 [Salmo trutta]
MSPPRLGDSDTIVNINIRSNRFFVTAWTYTVILQQKRAVCIQQGLFSSRMMSSTESGADVPKLHRLFIKFDPEVVAVMSILLGLMQVLLAVPLYYMDVGLPKLHIVLPLFIGFLFVTAGSFALACEKSPSRQLLTGCAYTNVASLVAGLLALCLYSVSLHSVQGSAAPCTLPNTNLYTLTAQKCPGEYLKEFFRSLIVLLIVYDLGALTLHSLLSFSALKGLRVGLCQMIN